MVAGLLQSEAQSVMLQAIDAEIAAAFQFARTSAFPQPGDWAPLNRSARSPLAEQWLPTSVHGEFDENQPNAKLAPY